MRIEFDHVIIAFENETRKLKVIPPDSKIASWHIDSRDDLSLETTLAFVLFSRPEVSGSWYIIYSNLKTFVMSFPVLTGNLNEKPQFATKSL